MLLQTTVWHLSMYHLSMSQDFPLQPNLPIYFFGVFTCRLLFMKKFIIHSSQITLRNEKPNLIQIVSVRFFFMLALWSCEIQMWTSLYHKLKCNVEFSGQYTVYRLAPMTVLHCRFFIVINVPLHHHMEFTMVKSCKRKFMI